MARKNGIVHFYQHSVTSWGISLDHRPAAGFIAEHNGRFLLSVECKKSGVVTYIFENLTEAQEEAIEYFSHGRVR